MPGIMETEGRLVEYVCGANFADLPSACLELIKSQLLTVLGTTIAGADADGCATLARFYRELGGKEEATILIHGGKIPAHSAALVNGVMARALDFCDALAPGAHIGSSIVPAALAAAELAGGCSGKEFLTALAIGTELGVRMNLSEAAYDGFDPTGVCVVFAATAAAARILGLNEDQTWNALALAFNRCGGSFQSNVDGSLAVRVIQGWVAESSVMCARLASRGITGPRHFLEGVYGYFHIFGRDRMDPKAVVAELGTRFDLHKILFKRYPSCGLTLGSTDVILSLIAQHGIEPGDVARVEVSVPPYTFKLVGHPFRIGSNPKVNAQFSISYCVANALLRRCSKLIHFEESFIRDPRVLALAERVHVIEDPALEARGHTPLEMKVITRNGAEYTQSIDIAPGFPGNPLSPAEHEERFKDCVGFAKRPLKKSQIEGIVTAVHSLDEMADIRTLIPWMLL
jgi:2-methylcitrate dehydratase PrpD